MSIDGSERAVAHIFNSAVAASAISAAWEVGALDELKSQGALDASEFATAHGLDPSATTGLFRALAAVDIVERADNKVTPAVNFEEAYRTRSFFHWLTRGSGELFRRMPELLPEQNRTGDYYQRDSAAISFACREISSFCYDPWFDQAVEGLDFTPRVIADLGCGSGERLSQLLRRHPEARGLGIDIARPSLEVAASAAHDAGLADRLSFVLADVRDMTERPGFAEVELLTCFMMGHDFWPRERCVDILRRLRSIFPATRRFLLGDATRTVGTADRDLPTFTLGFEVAHDLMGTFIPRVTDWESVFAEGGWRLRKKYAIDIAVGEVIFELEQL
ncbi:class I SAM-dependent methyltransferase [Streptomyces sp. NPDC000594]|uniref:class I SAM-dependent methyltransferase n=1 Tax=Streptomyces sp. NPDC000594 TaxID=3154261 RepID=UPI00331D5A9C